MIDIQLEVGKTYLSNYGRRINITGTRNSNLRHGDLVYDGSSIEGIPRHAQYVFYVDGEDCANFLEDRDNLVRELSPFDLG